MIAIRHHHIDTSYKFTKNKDFKKLLTKLCFNSKTMFQFVTELYNPLDVKNVKTIKTQKTILYYQYFILLFILLINPIKLNNKILN